MGKQFNRRKDSAYKYGLWAIDHIPFLSDDVTTYNELKNHIAILYEFLAKDWDGSTEIAETNFHPHKTIIPYGVEIRKLTEAGNIPVPFPKPENFDELQGNIATLNTIFIGDKSDAKQPFDFSILKNKEYHYNELREIGFPFDEFKDPEYDFIGIFIAKQWDENNPFLRCYFITDSEKKYKLRVWWNKDYCPTHSGISFKDVSVGTKWYCKVAITKKWKSDV